MSNIKGYEKYLPDKKEDTTLIQAKIDTPLHADIISIMEREEELNWKVLLTGLLTKFRDEYKSKRST